MAKMTEIQRLRNELDKIRAENAKLKARKATRTKGPKKLTFKTIPDPVYGDEGYVLIPMAPEDWDNKVLCSYLRAKGKNRLSWGKNGKCHPHWKAELGAYRVLKSALESI